MNEREEDIDRNEGMKSKRREGIRHRDGGKLGEDGRK